MFCNLVSNKACHFKDFSMILSSPAVHNFSYIITHHMSIPPALPRTHTHTHSHTHPHTHTQTHTAINRMTDEALVSILAHVSSWEYEGISQGLSREWKGCSAAGPSVKLLVSVLLRTDSSWVSGAGAGGITAGRHCPCCGSWHPVLAPDRSSGSRIPCHPARPQTGVQHLLPAPPLPSWERGEPLCRTRLSAPRGASRASAQPLVQVGLQEEQDQLSLRCLRPHSSEMSWSSHHLFRPGLTAESHDLEAFSPGSKLSKICSQCPHHAEACGFPDTHPLL